MSQLDDIEARLKAATPGAITITPSDIHYLRTLARKQADALEAVLSLANAHGRQGFLVAPADIRAALEPKP